MEIESHDYVEEFDKVSSTQIVRLMRDKKKAQALSITLEPRRYIITVSWSLSDGHPFRRLVWLALCFQVCRNLRRRAFHRHDAWH